MQINLEFLDVIIIIAYVLLLLLIGFFRGKSEKQKDIFLAGRSFSWPFVGFSLFATNVSPMMLIGFAGLAYSHGFAGANFEWLAWPLLLLLAFVFIPHYAKTKITTMPQFLQVRYGEKAYRFLAIYSLISILIVWVSSALYAGGIIVSQIFSWPLWISMAVIATLAGIFAGAGGLSAIVRTDVFQVIIIVLGAVILTFLALKKAGGITAVTQQVPRDYWKLFRPASDPDYPWYALLLGYPVAGLYYWCTDQTIVQKVLAARTVEDGQKGILFLAFLKVATPFIFILPGILCLVLYPHIDRPDNVYPTLIVGLMPHGLLGLSIAGLLAALINTVATGLNSLSTVFTLDFYNRYAAAGARKTFSVGRVVTIGGACIAFGVALLYAHSGKIFFDLSQGLVSLLAPPLSVVFITGVCWKKANSTAATVVLYGGGALCVIIGACYITNFPAPHFWPGFLLLSCYIFIFLLIVMILISLYTPHREGLELEPVWLRGPEGSSSIHRWGWWILLAAIMIILYIIFN